MLQIKGMAGTTMAPQFRTVQIKVTHHSTSPHGISRNTTMQGFSSLLPRDRFELLSAYLDGELSALERQQVESWLTQDSEVQQLYRRLLTLRQGFQGVAELSPPMQGTIETDRLVANIFDTVEQADRHRWFWRVGPAAAALVGVCTGIWFSSQRSWVPQMVQEPAPAAAPATVNPAPSLAIALDEPIMEFDFSATENTPETPETPETRSQDLVAPRSGAGRP